jgi:tRNA-2-methylthio-N6-dimethylallyladenosine synthase|tara:strand:- start:2371 stop:3822 length:1452 start_codon:yes stop_codon:yes gene_type:complete
MSEKNPYKYNGDTLVINEETNSNATKSVYIESYGCAMNFSDTEIVASILSENGYKTSNDMYEADLILVNTCSIREKAELTVRKRLQKFNKVRKVNGNLKVGVLGCMAERLKHKFLEEEKIVDMVVGPDAYKDLPNLLQEIEDGRSAVNVILSKDETYGDITPTRINSNGVNAFISITRGCDNMCTFCVVPFTRGRERSRDPQSIIEELNDLNSKGYREITLLGQNVDSYLWYGGGLKKDYSKASEMQKASSINFAKLLEMCALTQPKIRIRFSTSNPQDMSLDVIKIMAKYENICNYIHLPVQSGSNSILKAMNRQHTREEYITLIENIYKIIPDCSISHDMISGFPNESEQDHKDTLSLMEKVKYSFGYMFKYSERPGTPAAKKLDDNIDEIIKSKRLSEIVELQQKHSLYRSKQFIGKTVEVLIEKESKKSNLNWAGRNQQNTTVVFPKKNYKIGDFVNVKINDCTSATLVGLATGYSKNN